jgi:hypothetical protein
MFIFRFFFFISENPYRDKNRIEIFILSKPSQKYLINGIYYVFVWLWLCLGRAVFGFVFSFIFFDFCDISISDFKVRVSFQCEKNLDCS